MEWWLALSDPTAKRLESQPGSFCAADSIIRSLQIPLRRSCVALFSVAPPPPIGTGIGSSNSVTAIEILWVLKMDGTPGNILKTS